MKLIVIPIIFLFISCSDALDDSHYLLNIDLKPPVLKKVAINSSADLSIEFDEPVSFLHRCAGQFRTSPDP